MGRTGGVAELIGLWREIKKSGAIPDDAHFPIDLAVALNELEKTADPCLAKASKYEPIFVLRAQDALAPDAIDVWISDYRTYVLRNSEINDAKLAAAQKTADEMRAWPNRKMPD